MPTAAYADWLLEADMTSTYAYERSVLQMLQSRAPGYLVTQNALARRAYRGAADHISRCAHRVRPSRPV